MLAVQDAAEAVAGGIKRAVTASAAVARGDHIGDGEPLCRSMSCPVEEGASVVTLHRIPARRLKPAVYGSRDRDCTVRALHLRKLPAHTNQAVTATARRRGRVSHSLASAPVN